MYQIWGKPIRKPTGFPNTLPFATQCCVLMLKMDYMDYDFTVTNATGMIEIKWQYYIYQYDYGS
jgi:hypothetical protein